MRQKAPRAMRAGRIVVSATATALLTALLTELGTWVEPVAMWLERVQFLPAAAAFSLTVFSGWVIATLVFGRIYCSTVCPLGFYQDVAARIGRRIQKRPYRWAAPLNGLRYAVLGVTVVALAGGVAVMADVLDPYADYARICRQMLQPAWAWVVDFWAYPPVRLAAASATGFAAAALTAVVVGGVAGWRGRLWCNTFCPVGTTLGIVSRYSLLHFDIDTDRCTNCRRCEYACKAQCINLNDHVVDMSRCVVCFDCTASCPTGAIRYTLSSHTLSLPMMERIGRRPEAAGLGFGGGGATGSDSINDPTPPHPDDEAIS